MTVNERTNGIKSSIDHPAASYIVIDLEWNQPIPWIKTLVDPKELPGEIIEIGAVKISSAHGDYQVSKPFHVMIRPVCYTVMNRNVSKVTNKISSDLRFGLSFSDAYESFKEWCGQDYVLCGWGNSDLSILKANLRYHKHAVELNTLFLDIQPLFARIAEGKSQQRSVEYAVDFLRIPKKEDFHSAHRDAEYTGLILRELLQMLDKIRNEPVDSSRTDALDPMHSELMTLRLAPYLQNPDLHAETNSKTPLYASWDACYEDFPKDATMCPACGQAIVPQIPWFRLKKSGFSLWFCEEHHMVLGRMRMKKTPEGKVFAAVSVRLTDPGSARLVMDRYEEFLTYGIHGFPMAPVPVETDAEIVMNPDGEEPQPIDPHPGKTSVE